MMTPKGYKNTAVGLIPEDWQVKRLGDVSKITMGQSPKSQNYNTEEIGLPLIQGNADILNRRSIIRYYTSEITKKCNEGDFILSVRAPVGSVGIASFDSCIGRGVCSLKPKSINRIYLFQLLLFNEIGWRRIEQGSTFTAVSSEDVKSFRIPVTLDVNEQKAIAQVLSTWDKAIEKYESLLTQYELRKKWLMQNLLTGKKRLEGFSEEWKEVRIDKVTENFSKRNKDLINVRVYSVTNTNGFVLQSEHFEREIAGSDLSNYKIIKRGEFAYNPARINVGSLAYFQDEIGIISAMFDCSVTNSKILDYFLLQLLQVDFVTHRINSFGEGGVRVYLWYELFGKIKIWLPSIEEQTAIANILKTADKEIELMKTRIESLREQKKGLMQQLLTGKKRLNRNGRI